MIAADSQRATAARLAERLVELEGKVFELREQLGVDLGRQKVSRLLLRGMPSMEAKCLVLLYDRGDRVTDGQAFDLAVPPLDHAQDRGWKILNVVICRARKRLPAGAIRTVWRQGYVMTPLGRAVVAEWLGDAA